MQDNTLIWMQYTMEEQDNYSVFESFEDNAAWE